MNKSIKNALLLGAVVAMSGSVWSTGAYEDSQFDTTDPSKLTRKPSGAYDAFKRDSAWKNDSDAGVARDAYKTGFDARTKQNESDIKHLQSEIAKLGARPADFDQALVPSLGGYDITKWDAPGVKETQKFSFQKVGGSPGETIKVDKDGAEAANEALVAEAKKKIKKLQEDYDIKKTPLEARRDAIQVALDRKQQLMSGSDKVTHKTRRDILEEKLKAKDTKYQPFVAGVLGQADHFSDDAADFHLDRMASFVGKTVSTKDYDAKVEELAESNEKYTDYTRDMDPLLDAILALPQLVNYVGKLSNKSAPAKILAAVKAAKWDSGGAAPGGSTTIVPPPGIPSALSSMDQAELSKLREWKARHKPILEGGSQGLNPTLKRVGSDFSLTDPTADAEVQRQKAAEEAEAKRNADAEVLRKQQQAEAKRIADEGEKKPKEGDRRIENGSVQTYSAGQWVDVD